MGPPPDADQLPAAIPSLWRSLKLGYRAEPRLLVAAFVTTVLAAVPDALFALGLKLLAEGVDEGDERRTLLTCLGLGVLATGSWVLKTLSERVNRRFADSSTVVIESHVARLQAAAVGIEHHERPEHLDRLAVLRDQVFALNHLYGSLFATFGAVLRLVLTVVLLMSVHPVLVLLGAAAVPTVAVSTWGAGAERRAEERGAPHARLARHLFLLGTTPAPGKEVRVAGVGHRLQTDRRAAWERWYQPVAAARWRNAVAQSLAWAAFGGAYVAAVVYVASGLDAPAGDVLLVVAAGSRLSQYVGQTVSEASFLRGIWLDASRRLAWLEDHVAAQASDAHLPLPDRIVDGITLEGVTFRYPGTERVVLDDVDLHLPAGAVVAIVGENGAGKTTLVKLLCRFYEPDAGRILVDGADLAHIPAVGWRERTAGAFQDFFRFEYQAALSVGLGDLDHHDDLPAIGAAVGRAGADDVVEKLADGLRTQLGPTWPGGVEVSFGQWQKLALARGFMRQLPLLLVLDEPTAALDAETEHALFERYAAAARAPEGGQRGRITVLVSHRFSTVRMADLIVVLDGSNVAEHGTHEDLLARGGRYAELYGIQADAYR